MRKNEKANVKPKKLAKASKKTDKTTAKKTAKQLGLPAVLALAAGGAIFKMKKSKSSSWRDVKLVGGTPKSDGSRTAADGTATPAPESGGAKSPDTGAATPAPEAPAAKT